MSGQEIFDYFLQAGIVIMPGSAFGEDGNQYARFVFCVSEETVDKVCSLIDKLPQVGTE